VTERDADPWGGYLGTVGQVVALHGWIRKFGRKMTREGRSLGYWLAAGRSPPMTDWPEWCVRQPAPGENSGCVWIHAPTAEEALSLTHAITGPLGGWRTEIETEVFLRSEYAKRHHPHDFTVMVIAPRRKAGGAAR